MSQFFLFKNVKLKMTRSLYVLPNLIKEADEFQERLQFPVQASDLSVCLSSERLIIKDLISRIPNAEKTASIKSLATVRSAIFCKTRNQTLNNSSMPTGQNSAEKSCSTRPKTSNASLRKDRLNYNVKQSPCSKISPTTRRIMPHHWTVPE